MEKSPIRVDFVPAEALSLPEGSGTLGMVSRPVRKIVMGHRRGGRSYRCRGRVRQIPGQMERIERFRGAMLGLAGGDALSSAVEFKQRGTFEPLTDMVESRVHGIPAGYWTDDTSMALCLAESLIEKRGMNLADQPARYLRWWREGYLSSTGECFDIGSTIQRALSNFERTGDPYSGSTNPREAGNGSIMRLAPVPLFFASDMEAAAKNSAESSRTTHCAEEAVDACRYFGVLIAGTANGIDKDALLSESFAPGDLSPNIQAIASGSFKRKKESGIQGTGYCVYSLEAALWAFHNSGSFEEGALLAVNLGDDADTTGAVYGQLAGAFYGESNIPQRWRKKLRFREKIKNYAEDLFARKPRGAT